MKLYREGGYNTCAYTYPTERTYARLKCLSGRRTELLGMSPVLKCEACDFVFNENSGDERKRMI